MLKKLKDRWTHRIEDDAGGDSASEAPPTVQHDSRPKTAQWLPESERPLRSNGGSPGKPPVEPIAEETETPPPTLPPGQTVREHLGDRILLRSRWLEGRYGRDREGTDHGALLDSLQAPASAVIRRPPLAARRLLQETRRGTANLNQIAQIIEGDPALFQSVLKHANSVFYATGVGGNPIVSITAALHRMGFKGIEIVVMSHMVEGSLCRPGGGLDAMAGAVWSHMIRVAPLARAFSSGFGVNADEAYAMGMLHDVGKLILFNRVADLRKKLRRPVHLDPAFIPAALRELHGPLGGLAVLEWGLGETASMAVAHHHRDPVPHPPAPLSEVVYLTERLDLLMEQGVDVDLERIWEEGELTANLDRVLPIWERVRPEPEEGD